MITNSPTLLCVPGRRDIVAAVGFALLLLVPAAARGQNARNDFWVTNGTVTSMVRVGSTLYVGGSFSFVCPPTGAGVPVDSSTGVPAAGFANIVGQVFAAAPDGTGGWYVGGAFTTAGGQPRANLAHVLGDGTLDAWNPSANATVRALVVSDGIVYVGGDFTTAGGQSRNRIAAIDAATGIATAWDPNAGGIVRALVPSGGTMFVGGDFLTMGGQSRSRLAAVDLTTAVPSAWNPGANNAVRALAQAGGVVYVGGDFTNAAGVSRQRIAAIDATSGAALAWNPGANGQVACIAPSGDTLYIGGQFSNAGGQVRNRLAAIGITSGLTLAWNPNANGSVLALAVSGGTLYAGGDFTTIGGIGRSRLASFDVASGGLAAWNPNAYSTVSALSAGAGTVFVGGNFAGIGGTARNNLAAFDVVSGAVTGWNPNPDAQVLALLDVDGTLYVGGTFTSIGGAARADIAAVDETTGFATAWNPGTDAAVTTFAAGGGRLFAGGDFTIAGGLTRGHLAAFDLATGAMTAWDPEADASVMALTCSGSVVYVGGSFSTVGGAARNMLAAVDGTSGVALPWNPNTNGTVRAVIATCNTVYAGGFFTTIGATARNRIAAIDAATGLATGFDGNANGPVLALALDGGTLYVGGVLNGIGAQVRNRIAALDPVTGAATPWNPNANNVVRTLLPAGGTVYAGGNFGSIGGAQVSSIAALGADNTITCPAIAVGPTSIPDARADSAYNVTFAASGGTGPYCYAVSAGALPPGLTLNSGSGSLSGSPSAAGTFEFTISATMSNACTGTRSYSLLVRPACPLIAVTPSRPPDARTDQAYSQALSATAGTAPFTFALTAGALPSGITLGSSGLLSGTPSATGTFTFTVHVTDAELCAGSQPCTLTVRPPCVALGVRPTGLPDTWVGDDYHATLTTLHGTAPFTWAVHSGSLPDGLVLDASGALHGSPTTTGSYTFAVTVFDQNQCGDSLSYTMNVFATSPASRIAADTHGSCITSATPVVTVPVVLTRADAAPAIGASVTFHLDSHLALPTPAHPDSSIRQGTWLPGGAFFQVTDNGGGSYTVDQAVLGNCGPDSGGTLFTVDVRAVAGDGLGSLTVDACSARQCDNTPIPVSAGPAGPVTVDNAGPARVTALAATQVLTGNAGQRTGIVLTWSGGTGAVSLYRAPFGAYPEYDDDGPVAPPDSSLAPGGPWTLVATGVSSGFVDDPPVRGVWHYVAFTRDSCGAVSAVSPMTRGTLNYHLGDVVDGVTPGQGDDRVDGLDISLLGANYGIGDAAITARGVAYLDVGPTVDGTPHTRPRPDDHVDFDDLMIFAANYHVVSAPAALAATLPAGAADSFAVTAPEVVAPGADVTATLSLSGSGRIQGFSARLLWDATVVAPIAVHSSRFIEAQGGIVLSPGAATVDAALLGAHASGITGAGDVAAIAFRVLRAGDPGIRLAEVRARDAANRPIAPALLQAGAGTAPAVTALLRPSTNPFRDATVLSFSLATAGTPELSVYGIDGRRVRTLAAGARAPGVYHVTWDGRDTRGRAMAPGVYYVRLAAGRRTFTTTLVHLE